MNARLCGMCTACIAHTEKRGTKSPHGIDGQRRRRIQPGKEKIKQSAGSTALAARADYEHSLMQKISRNKADGRGWANGYRTIKGYLADLASAGGLRGKLLGWKERKNIAFCEGRGGLRAGVIPHNGRHTKSAGSWLLVIGFAAGSPDRRAQGRK